MIAVESAMVLEKNPRTTPGLVCLNFHLSKQNLQRARNARSTLQQSSGMGRAKRRGLEVCDEERQGVLEAFTKA